ncbi:uncharacterized protein LOC107266641 isoform X2 [Cephus cinctus]|uniref:Uncharacterized protein LOC107266641 isoform X2 n=1 Tax=Cephus cinctus TaxID=211228 RepID=A0AAJ7RFE6_CEPCN|nr:uncharacterized protein LOC107266641 isoform X2 [Cephus cinctus]
MAVVGDAVYNLMNGVPLYVSSNAYYGYVPPSSRASAPQDFNYQHEAGQRNDFSHKGATRNHCGYGLAMETDADSYENSEGARCINNPCVIPEVPRRLTVGHREDGHEHLRERRTIHDAASRCRNRKRNSDDLALFAPMKKFREDPLALATLEVFGIETSRDTLQIQIRARNTGLL